MTQEANLCASKILYTGMTILHICLKKYEDVKKDDPSHKGFDMKFLILACLRISAVIYDVELPQDAYTKIYYESVIKDEDKS